VVPLVRRGGLDQADGPANEVGVPLDDLSVLELGGVVEHVVVGVDRLQVQGDRGALGCVGGFVDPVGVLPGGLPPGPALLAGATGDEGDFVGDHERGVEPDAELPDQRLRALGVLGGLERGEQVRGAGSGDRADQVDHLAAGHADSEAGFVQGVGGVGDQLAQEHVLVRVQRVHHHVQQLPGFGLEFEGLDSSGHASRPIHQIIAPIGWVR
jgi:hypothetical protein